MIGLHAAGITDVGQRREGNEDSLHVGDSVFAVADGMGGHRGGEVASALALRPLAALDGRVFGDVEEARSALGTAVIQANRQVVDAAAHDDALTGMGTTLTAALFEGRRLHVAHVGDSRAYLLRGGVVVQLTRDHTFVQQLLDDGRITADEVATHPHRSVITRAIGAREEVEVDLETIDLQHDDAILLCSDGLSGVVDDGRIAALLTSGMEPEEIVTALVDEANDAGGPDNITAVLLTVVDDRGVAPGTGPDDEPTTGDGSGEPGDGPATAPVPPSASDDATDADRDDGEVMTGGMLPGRTADTADTDGDPVVTSGRPPGALLIRPDVDAGQMRPLPGPGPDESLVVDPALRRRRIASVVVAVATVLGLLLGGGRWLLTRSYYVGLDGDEVAIYQGIPASIGPIELSWVFEETGLAATQLPPDQVERLEEGLAAIDSADARQRVSVLRALADDDGDDPSDAPTEGLVSVRAVIGLPDTDALEALEGQGLTVTIAQLPSDTVERGTVMSQEPRAGIEVEVGSTVELEVSAGQGDSGTDAP